MATAELVPFTPTAVETLDLAPRAWDLAQRIARTEFVPGALRGKPEAVMAAMLTGHEVGIGPMQALSKIHVIDGRPAMSAELMRALVLRAGHELWIEESTTTRCTVAGTRAGAPRETRITWTVDDAKRAGLGGRPNWQKYPQAMLLARASAALCRAIFPEVLAGLSYAIEELEDGDIVDTTPVDGHEGDSKPPPRRTRKAARSITAKPTVIEDAETVPPEREVPALPGEDDPVASAADAGETAGGESGAADTAADSPPSIDEPTVLLPVTHPPLGSEGSEARWGR